MKSMSSLTMHFKQQARRRKLKIGFAPFTRNYLKSKHVRHDHLNDLIAEEYGAIKDQNTMACALLNFFGYNGDLLKAHAVKKNK